MSLDVSPSGWPHRSGCVMSVTERPCEYAGEMSSGGSTSCSPSGAYTRALGAAAAVMAGKSTCERPPARRGDGGRRADSVSEGPRAVAAGPRWPTRSSLHFDRAAPARTRRAAQRRVHGLLRNGGPKPDRARVPTATSRVTARIRAWTLIDGATRAAQGEGCPRSRHHRRRPLLHLPPKVLPAVLACATPRLRLRPCQPR